MFATYSSLAITDNWMHDFICDALAKICASLDEGREPPTWNELVPEKRAACLRPKRALPKLLDAFALEASRALPAARAEFLRLLTEQNEIARLLDGTIEIPDSGKNLKGMLGAATGVFAEGFALLAKTGLRDEHYRVIWNNLGNKTCPFCGLEPFESPELRREDEDHYLARSIYPLAAANLSNLVPMGGKCNKLYKGQVDILRTEGGRRKAINPYGDIHLDISLMDSNPFGEDDSPDWQITLVPDSEEARTWQDVFFIRDRLLKGVLAPYFDAWLDELSDWFGERGADNSIGDDELVDILRGFTAYKVKHKEIGPGFLKHKVMEMLTHHCSLGNTRLIAMIRASLPAQRVTA